MDITAAEERPVVATFLGRSLEEQLTNFWRRYGVAPTPLRALNDIRGLHPSVKLVVDAVEFQRCPSASLLSFIHHRGNAYVVGGLRQCDALQETVISTLKRQGFAFVSSTIFPNALAVERLTSPGVVPSITSMGHDLTTRQLEVLQLIAEGLENSAIGFKLFLSEDTIRTHVKNILKKLRANNRAHAVAVGYQKKILAVE